MKPTPADMGIARSIVADATGLDDRIVASIAQAIADEREATASLAGKLLASWEIAADIIETRGTA